MAMFGLFQSNPLSQLSYLSLDVLVTETVTLPSDVTKYPIEDGSGDFTDHITAHNEEIKISGMISAATSFGMEFGPLCYSKMIDAVDQLRKMHKERTTVTVQTGLGKYEDMAFTDLSIERSNSPTVGGQWLTINAGLRKIIKVTLKTADLPPDPNSSAAGKTGKTEQKVSKPSNNTNNVPESFESQIMPSSKKGPELGYDPADWAPK
jgi:hypothetical protein